MKRYLVALTIISGVMLVSCDPMEEDLRLWESQPPATGDEGARTKYPNITLKRGFKVYELTELVYATLTDEELAGEAEITLKNAEADRETFLQTMINTSMRSFDAMVSTKGGFLSTTAKRNYQAKTSAGWNVNFDPDLRAQLDAFLKIPDIPASDEGDEHYVVLGANNADSLLRFNTRELVALAKFLDVLPRYLNDPAAMEEALNELSITHGVSEGKVGLLLPAVQKARESANSSGFNGGIKVASKDVKGFYELDAENLPGDYFRFGGYGAITGLISRDFDNSGDLDWSLIQLHRRKFEMEMWLLWDEYWKKYANPATGR